MLFVPYGADAGPVRFPWGTTIIVAACLAVHVFASIKDARRERLLLQLKAREEKLASVERVAGDHLQGFDSALREAGIVGRGERSITEGVKRALDQVRAQRRALEGEMIRPRFGLVPARGGPWWTYVSHAFLHAGWFHLLGNLWFLWLSAVSLEHRFGWLRLMVLYAAGTVSAGLFFSLWHPGATEAAVGASGAVSATIGGFLVSLYRTRIRIFWLAMWFVGPRWGTFAVPAWAAVPFWLVVQLLGAGMEASLSMGVAYSAHLGGFAVGLVVAALFELFGGVEEDDARIPSASPSALGAAPATAVRPEEAPAHARAPGPATAPVGPGMAPASVGSGPSPDAASDPRGQIKSFLRRFPEVDPVRQKRVEAFLAWRSGQPGHLLTQAHVSMYVNALGNRDLLETHETRALLMAFVDHVGTSLAQRLRATSVPLPRLPRGGADSTVVGKVIGATAVLVFLGVGAYFWGRVSASRDCASFEDSLGERRASLIENTRAKAEIVERVRKMAREWNIEAEPDDVDVALERLTFVTLTKLPGDEMFAFGIGGSDGPNPNAVLTIAVDAPAPRFLATGRCRFERSMRVVTAGKRTPISSPAEP